MKDYLKKRWVRGGFALLVGGAGGFGLALLLGRGLGQGRADSSAEDRDRGHDSWARPGMSVTFRAELMPGREHAERTFRVAELLPSGRVRLESAGGEHAENEFESAR
ncbi:MAG TPA: hypothetical protein VK421_18975 [Pyrinomonadaceae bacterium]|nr:hypothetical protein [Pyrinomonadaceae bacterium]